MSIITNWVFLSAFAALTFGIGDFIVVLSEEFGMDVFTLYMAYNIIVGLLCFLYIIIFGGSETIINFNNREWVIVLMFSLFYFVAYLSHFQALQRAPNPGYSNALIMFHVVILTLLSYYILSRPLNKMTILGIIIAFIGSYIVTLNA